MSFLKGGYQWCLWHLWHKWGDDWLQQCRGCKLLLWQMILICQLLWFCQLYKKTQFIIKSKQARSNSISIQHVHVGTVEVLNHTYVAGFSDSVSSFTTWTHSLHHPCQFFIIQPATRKSKRLRFAYCQDETFPYSLGVLPGKSWWGWYIFLIERNNSYFKNYDRLLRERCIEKKVKKTNKCKC